MRSPPASTGDPASDEPVARTRGARRTGAAARRADQGWTCVRSPAIARGAAKPCARLHGSPARPEAATRGICLLSVADAGVQEPCPTEIDPAFKCLVVNEQATKLTAATCRASANYLCTPAVSEDRCSSSGGDGRQDMKRDERVAIDSGRDFVLYYPCNVLRLGYTHAVWTVRRSAS